MYIIDMYIMYIMMVHYSNVCDYMHKDLHAYCHVVRCASSLDAFISACKGKQQTCGHVCSNAVVLLLVNVTCISIICCVVCTFALQCDSFTICNVRHILNMYIYVM